MGCITSRSSEQGEMSSRRSPPPPASAAAVLDDDDLLSEILLRLPPQPSSLPRASLVCKRWRRLLSDPSFSRRFRRHHHHNSPLLGFFVVKNRGLSFVPTMEAPNRVPPRRFSLEPDGGGPFRLLGYRHGLVLFFDASRKQVLVWDPVTADQHRIAIPAGFDKTVIHGTVLRAAGDVQHFQVVLAGAEHKDKQHRRALACLYSSNTGLWGNLASTPILSNSPISGCPYIVRPGKPARLVGNSLYWFLAANFLELLEFGLERQNLTVIPVPVGVCATGNFTVTRAECGALGFFFLSDFTAYLWKRTTNGDGVASWVLGRTIQLDKLLSLNSEEERRHLWIMGYAEDNNVVFLQTLIGIFMIHLESLQFKKLSGHNLICKYHPFESVYAAGI